MRVAVIGNCQAQSYALLCREMLGADAPSVFDFSLPQSRETAYQERFFGTLDEADLVLVQPNAFAFASPALLRERHGERVVSVPNFYFRGLFPDICYVGAFGRRFEQPSSYHSLVVIEAFRRGLSAEEAARRFTPETYARLGLFDGWQSSLEEMARRDEQVALPGAPVVERCSLAEQSFLTINHPTLHLIKTYLAELFEHLGLRWRNVESRELVDPLSRWDRLPVADEIAEFLHLPYRTTQRWYLPSLGDRFLDRAAVIEAFYAQYRAAEPDQIRINSPTDMVRFLRGREEYADLVAPEAEAH